ncbi:unnamed protein product [Anisakis simplex]|uniref:Uncharacterized protein n=1 Tax=Anisakis simplex TaxID=6269 RepID=A0A0M3JFD8_ANISI|nr:unnamed protein product [Anisakis simplex]
MGRCKNIGRNVSKYRLKMSRKQTNKIYKRKKATEEVEAATQIDSGADNVEKIVAEVTNIEKVSCCD